MLAPSLISREPFVSELLGAADGATRRLVVEEGIASPGVRSRFAKVDDDDPDGGGGGTCHTRCIGDWTLTCQNCSFGPYTDPGRVECSTQGSANRVYWQQNVPTGPWTTVGDQSITAEWRELQGGCPTEVTNSLGHTYSVEID